MREISFLLTTAGNGLVLGLLVVLPPPARADLCLSYRLETVATRLKTGEVFHHESERGICLDESHARFDIGRISFLVDLEHRAMWLLDHKDRTSESLSIPVVLENLLSGELAEAHKNFAQMVAPDTIGEDIAPGIEIVGKWKARKYRVAITTSSEYTFGCETWTTSEIPLAGGMQGALHTVLRSYYELDSPARTWIDRVLERPGVAVRFRFNSNDGRVSREETWILKDVSDLPPEPSRFQTPPDYVEKPFDITRFMQVVTPTVPVPPS